MCILKKVRCGLVSVVLCCLSLCGLLLAQSETEPPPIPMRLELHLVKDTCVVYENFPLTIRIVNPNDFSVTFRGVNFDYYIEPEIYLLWPGEDDMLLRYQASVSALTNIPITIPGGEALVIHRFLWIDNLAALWWPNEPGTFQRQPKFGFRVRTPAIDGWQPVDWERPIVELRVQAPSPLDRQASTWLYQRFEKQYREKTPPGIARNVNLDRIRMYDEFLRRFPDSSYASAIRWETVKLLQDKLGNRAIPADDVEQMVDLFDECLTFCLKQGGAYAEEFLTWYADARAGGSEVLELAFMHGRGALFKRLVEGIDRKYPDDAEGILYRQVIVAGLTESMEETDKIAQTLKNRFPNSRYARHLPRLLRQIKKQRKAYPTPE